MPRLGIRDKDIAAGGDDVNVGGLQRSISVSSREIEPVSPITGSLRSTGGAKFLVKGAATVSRLNIEKPLPSEPPLSLFQEDSLKPSSALSSLRHSPDQQSNSVQKNAKDEEDDVNIKGSETNGASGSQNFDMRPHNNPAKINIKSMYASSILSHYYHDDNYEAPSQSVVIPPRSTSSDDNRIFMKEVSSCGLPLSQQGKDNIHQNN